MNPEPTNASFGRGYSAIGMRAYLLGFIILVCGMVIGAGAATYVVWHHMEGMIRDPRMIPHRIVSHMQGQLDLSDEQVREIEAIFQEHHEAFEELRREMEPRVEAEVQAIRGEVSSVLTPEQRKEFGERFDMLRRRWMPGPRFKPPGFDGEFRPHHHRDQRPDSGQPYMGRPFDG